MKLPIHPDYHVEVTPLNDMDACGVTYYDYDGSRRICLDPFQAYEEKMDTVLHEFIHATYPEFTENEVARITAEWILETTSEQDQELINYYYQTVWQKIGNVAVWISNLRH